MREIVFVETNATGHGVRAIEKARRLGLSVRFLTSQRDFYRSAGVDQLALADRVEEVDTGDVEQLLAAIDQARTAGVITFLDYPLLSAAELAARLGLPHPEVEGLRNCRFKDLTRTLLARAGETRPRFAILGEGDLPPDSPVGYPCVVKPVDDSGSVGVQVCRDRAELHRALAAARARRRNVRSYLLARRWLVEEYVEGPEYSAEMLHVGGSWRVLGLTRKLLSPPPFCVELGHVFPAALPAERSAMLAGKLVEWVTELRLSSGAAHVEFRLTEGGPVLMEVNPRLGGGLIPELIQLVLGFDPVEHLLRSATRMCSPAPGDLAPRGAAAIAFLTSRLERGVVRHVEGMAALDRLGFVVEAALPRVGTPCRAPQSNYDRLGHVIVRGDDAESAVINARRAVEAIQLTVGEPEERR